MGDPRVKTSLAVKASVWKQVRIRAFEEGRTTADLLEQALVAYLKQVKRGGTK